MRRRVLSNLFQATSLARATPAAASGIAPAAAPAAPRPAPLTAAWLAGAQQCAAFAGRAPSPRQRPTPLHLDYQHGLGLPRHQHPQGRWRAGGPPRARPGHGPALPSVAAAESWQALGAHPQIAAALAQCGAAHPTPVQRAAVPRILAGRSAAAQGPTGSGKVQGAMAAPPAPPLDWCKASIAAQAAPQQLSGNHF
jgi:hypothetical protein